MLKRGIPQRVRIMFALLSLSRARLLTFAVGFVVGIAAVYLHGLIAGYVETGSGGGIIVPLGKQNGWGSFPEAPWVVEGVTLARRVVAETPFARFEVHRVKTETGEIINDWLWTDERSHVNILVHLKEENRYLMFEQRKYGLKENKLAVIGGLCNFAKESAAECAARELLEETGLEAGELVSLGEYRVQVNRGGGILYAYYAKNSVKSSKTTTEDPDYEKQARKLMSSKELIEAALRGEVGEAQWVAAVALGLLYEEHVEHHAKLAK